MDRVYTELLCRVKSNWEQRASYLHPFMANFTPVSRGYLETSKVNEFFVISLVSFRRERFVQEESSRYRETRFRRFVNEVSFSYC